MDVKFGRIELVSAKSLRATLLKIVLCIGLRKKIGQISKFKTAIKLLASVLLNQE